MANGEMLKLRPPTVNHTEQRRVLSFHLFARVGSRWSTLHDGEILVNSGGISPEEREKVNAIGVSQSRDGGSSAFDFLFAYSGHQTIGKLSATLQNRSTKNGT